MPWHLHESQGKTSKNLLSSFIMCIPEIIFRSSGLMASALKHLAISLATIVLNFKIYLLYIICMSLPAYMCSRCESGAHGSQKKVLDAVEHELHTPLIHYVGAGS